MIDSKLHRFFSVQKKAGVNEDTQINLKEPLILEKRTNPHKLEMPFAQGMSQDAKLEQKVGQKLSKQRSKKRKSFSVSLKRKKVDSLKLSALMTDSTQAKLVSDSFAWAFFAKKMQYTPRLVYDHPRVHESMNVPKELEPKL